MRLQARRVARELDRLRFEMRASTTYDSTVLAWADRIDGCLLLLALPKRKVRVKDPSRAARRTSVKELDALAREVVFARDKGQCQMCGNTATDWSHIRTRRYRSTRWMPENGLALCRGCHMNKWHQEPHEAVAWFTLHYPERIRAIQAASRRTGINLIAVRQYLMDERKRYA